MASQFPPAYMRGNPFGEPLSPLASMEQEELRLRAEIEDKAAQEQRIAEVEARRQREAEALRGAEERIGELRGGTRPPMRLPGAPSFGPSQAELLDPGPMPPTALPEQLGRPPVSPSPETMAQVAPPPPAPIRAVKMPDGKIVFTNIEGGRYEGAETLSEDEGRREARAIGSAGPQGPPPYAATDPNGRFANLGTQQSYELVQRAAGAGGPGTASAMELKPGDDGGFTPGYGRMREQQAGDTIDELQRRGSVADAASAAQLAEAWAKMSPEDRLRAQAALKAAERPNFPLQTIQYLQGELAQIDAKQQQLQSEAERRFPNAASSPDGQRLKAEYIARGSAALEAERQRILQIGGLPFKADPLSMLLSMGQPGGGAAQYGQ